MSRSQRRMRSPMPQRCWSRPSSSPSTSPCGSCSAPAGGSAVARAARSEEISDAVALVFVVVSLGLSGLGRDRLAGLDDQLLRSLAQTHERSIRISRPLVSFQHVFHGRHEAGVGLERDHPLPIAVRLERVFFNVRPIVLSLALPTMANSTTFSSSRRRLQRANPSGAGEQARAISFASAAPSKIRGRAEFGLNLRFSVASNPSSTSC